MEECSICLDELFGSIVILKCKHKYHDICIGTWYESNIKNNTNFVCPQCNTVTDIETIINVEPDTQNNIEMNPLFISNPNISSESPNIGNESPNIGNDSPNMVDEGDRINMGSDGSNTTSDSLNMVSDNQSVVYTPLNMRSSNTTRPITRTNMEQELEQDDIIINKNKCLRCCIS